MARRGRPVGLQLETLQALALVIALEAAGLSRRRHKLLRLADALGSVAGEAQEIDRGDRNGLSLDPGPRAVVSENRLEELSIKLSDGYWQKRHAEWPDAAAREMRFVENSARVLTPMFRLAGTNIEVRGVTLLGLGWELRSVSKVLRFARGLAAAEQRANRPT